MNFQRKPSYARACYVLYRYNEGLFLLSSYVVIDYDFECVILPILKLHMYSLNGCSLI